MTTLALTLSVTYKTHCVRLVLTLQLVFLQADRYVEFHTQSGRHYRTRIPKYGRDLAYHSASCDLYFVGAGYASLVFKYNVDICCFGLLLCKRVIKVLIGKTLQIKLI